MNRRSFFKRLATAVGASLLPITTLSFDPVTSKVVKPTLDTSPVLGYKGSQFLEAGVIYAPYIPLIQTAELVKDPKFTKYYKTYRISVK